MAIGEREKQMGVSRAAEMVNRGRGYGNRGERSKWACLELQIWLIEGVVMAIGEREKQMGESKWASRAAEMVNRGRGYANGRV